MMTEEQKRKNRTRRFFWAIAFLSALVLVYFGRREFSRRTDIDITDEMLAEDMATLRAGFQKAKDQIDQNIALLNQEQLAEQHKGKTRWMTSHQLIAFIGNPGREKQRKEKIEQLLTFIEYDQERKPFWIQAKTSISSKQVMMRGSSLGSDLPDGH